MCTPPLARRCLNFRTLFFFLPQSKHKLSFAVIVQLFTFQFLLVLASRAVDTGLDMTGGAEALVNKAGFEHVSRCSGALVSTETKSASL